MTDYPNISSTTSIATTPIFCCFSSSSRVLIAPFKTVGKAPSKVIGEALFEIVGDGRVSVVVGQIWPKLGSSRRQGKLV